MRTLFIDTTDSSILIVSMVIEKEKYIVQRKRIHQKAQIVLPIIALMLQKYAVKLEDFYEINVNEGPGTFTGTRVGVSIANALSFALGVPVNNRKTLIEPKYSS